VRAETIQFIPAYWKGGFKSEEVMLLLKNDF